MIGISRNKKLCTRGLLSFYLRLGVKFTPTGNMEGERWSWEERSLVTEARKEQAKEVRG